MKVAKAVSSHWRSHCLLALSFALASCMGDAPGAGGTPAGPSSQNGPGTAKTSTTVVGATGVPFPARMQRLTAVQYRATIADIFGDAVIVPELEPDSRIAGFEQVGASRISTSVRGVELYAAAARAVAKQALGNAERPVTVGCVPVSESIPDASCSGMFLDRVGRRILRRPLEAAERDRYLNIASEGATATGNFWGGLEIMLSGLLESPLFIYRAEWGEGTSGGVARYEAYDMAARLSFGLLDAAPDDDLLNLAARGELDSNDGVKQHAARLLASERGQRNLESFFATMLHLPNGTSAEARAMKQETLLVLRELSTQKAPFTELFTAPFTFVNDTLAELYGLPDRPGAALAKVLLPSDSSRRGLLGHAGVLVESGAEQSAILRGKYIREALLCQVIPPPPPNVVALLATPAGEKAQTMRERLAQHRADPACGGCHNLMDPPGLALENFDGSGRYRADDKGLVIDPSGDLDGIPFSDAAGLGAALAAHPAASGCLVATLQRRLTGQHEEVGQTPTIERLRDAYLGDRKSVDDLLLDLVLAETFLQVTLPAD